MLFVGEKRSKLAVKLGLRWEDGGLAAKPLFEALRACGIEPTEHKFINWFEPDNPKIIMKEYMSGERIVALGKKVQIAMMIEGIEFISLIHPAARGKIRRRDRYIAHVKQQLEEDQLRLCDIGEAD